MIDLTDTSLFQDLTYIQFDNAGFDLHNDYHCVEIAYNSKDDSIQFTFNPTKKGIIDMQVYLFFQNAKIENLNLVFERTADTTTINNFYRGKFERENTLLEYLETGERFFYIEFEEGDKFEIFARRVFLSYQTVVKNPSNAGL
ncbi:MAG: hypothetical protein M9904_18470 [Chitinophagaceae bacterium]|nr:hypothetical protein [Chitinophagaceae bacterium]